MSRRHSVVVGMLVVGLVTAAAAPAMAEAPVRTYEVTITNNTEGQPLTPALVATHNRRDGLFRQGRAASLGLQQIAENGNLDPMLARLDRDRDFFDVELGFGASAPPVMPGESVSVTIDARYPYRYLSFVSMLICSNDGFAGISSVRLPKHVGQSMTVRAAAYDAGTERNTEDWEDIVPPCAPLTGFDNGGEFATESNPALAEDRRVHRHRGIRGVGDLDPATHGWDNAPATVVITRTS